LTRLGSSHLHPATDPYPNFNIASIWEGKKRTWTKNLLDNGQNNHLHLKGEKKKPITPVVSPKERSKSQRLNTCRWLKSRAYSAKRILMSGKSECIQVAKIV
jgi:hypothetical protein